ncbi:MAG: hypothetical protein V2A58_06995 [Planctomycetota bacterium]
MKAGMIATAVVAVFFVLAGEQARAVIVYKDYLVNPSFEEGEDGKEPDGWSSESLPSVDKTSFIKAKGGRPKEVKEGEKADEGEAHLVVKGEDRSASGSQIVAVKISEPTQFKFSAWVKCEGGIKAHIWLEGLRLDKEQNRFVTPEGGERKNVEFVPATEWTRVAVSKVFPATTERVKLGIVSFSHDTVLAVDDCALIQGFDAADFDWEKEAEELAGLRRDATDHSEEMNVLGSLFEEMKKLQAVAIKSDGPEAERKDAAQRLPELIQEYLAKKDALKKALLESLVQ